MLPAAGRSPTPLDSKSAARASDRPWIPEWIALQLVRAGGVAQHHRTFLDGGPLPGFLRPAPTKRALPVNWAWGLPETLADTR
jgi:hypothetical protein